MKLTAQVWGEETGEFLADFFGTDEYQKYDEWENDYSEKDIFDIEDFKEMSGKYSVFCRVYKNGDPDNIVFSNE